MNDIILNTIKKSPLSNTNFRFLLSIIFIIILQSCSKETLEESIQSDLDEGMTPLEVYNNHINENYNPGVIGFNYGGGIIIDFNPTDGTGLIASHHNLENSPWGCFDTYIPALLPNENATFGSDLGDGLENTLRILASDCGESSAAKVCDEYSNDGYDDWFLPSEETLSLLSITEAKDEYWSSTGVSNNSKNAWTLFVNKNESCEEGTYWFGLGTIYYCSFSNDRHALIKVRAVRKF